MDRPRFIVDSMLGDLARWLRLLGYDTLYYRNAPDPRLVTVALEQGRIIVTRDKGLSILARKKGARVIMLRGENIEEMLAELHLRAGVALYADPGRSRCPLCNSPLRHVPKHEVKDRVPPEVYVRYEDFWLCPKCGQVYWQGSHWRKIRETLEKAREIADRLAEARQRRGSAAATSSHHRIRIEGKAPHPLGGEAGGEG
ncbi:Mut7-C RNAse domain-containing protein [Pyrolobus fumarii]|nr:Mut7-C RNAse domain-containing protein [Pyrolobus fumarii]